MADSAQAAMIAAVGVKWKMRRRSMWWLALVAVLMVGGCATEVGPSPAELKAQWEAQNVFPQNYKADLTAYMRTYLNDPTHVRGASVSQPQLKPVGPGERYVACVRYDARKGGGQYAGPKEGAAIYVSNKLDRFLDVPREVREFCKDAAYAPFPELEALTR
jgi:hypothetical protein